jgi:hypothetical protein
MRKGGVPCGLPPPFSLPRATTRIAGSAPDVPLGMNTIATPWSTFERDNLPMPIGLLERIRNRTADAWVVVEPLPDGERRGRFWAKAPKSVYSATISPFADDDDPHFIVYLTFPKGSVFSDRGMTMPSWAAVDDENKDDATLRTPISTPLGDTIGLAMAALDSCSDSPLGDAWRAAIGDTYVSRSAY